MKNLFCNILIIATTVLIGTTSVSAQTSEAMDSNVIPSPSQKEVLKKYNIDPPEHFKKRLRNNDYQSGTRDHNHSMDNDNSMDYDLNEIDSINDVKDLAEEIDDDPGTMETIEEFQEKESQFNQIN